MIHEIWFSYFRNYNSWWNIFIALFSSCCSFELTELVSNSYYLAATYVGSTSKTKLLIANHNNGPQPNLLTLVGVIKKQEIKVWFTLPNCYLKCSSWSTNRWMTITRGSKWKGLNVDEENIIYHHDQMIIIFNFESLGHVCAEKTSSADSSTFNEIFFPTSCIRLAIFVEMWKNVLVFVALLTLKRLHQTHVNGNYEK